MLLTRSAGRSDLYSGGWTRGYGGGGEDEGRGCGGVAVGELVMVVVVKGVEYGAV